jgi:hypothetical protein
MTTAPPTSFGYRWVAPMLVFGAALLVPWTIVLAYRLPSQHTSHHWDVAWVGFNVALVVSLAATGLSIARRASWATSAAAVAAALLLCDAWFDNVLANGGGEHLEAALEAVLVELPLALFCLLLARHCEQTVAAVRGAFGRERPQRRVMTPDLRE